MDKKETKYLENIKSAFKTLKKGMSLTIGHAAGNNRKAASNTPVWDADYLKPGKEHFTLQYPYEQFAIPDHGRYKLHNEIEDCIVCDKCAKVCPVDCIDIEPIRSPEVIGHTSDGTPKRIYAAKFDIDMAKCCFCGLCTTVCPTECLTMTPEYDFSAFDFEEHKVSFADMTPIQILEAKKAWEAHEQKKEAEKEAKAKASTARPKPDAMRPKSSIATPKEAGAKTEEDTTSKPRPAFKPRIKPKAEDTAQAESQPEQEAKPKPIFRPKPMMKPKLVPKKEATDEAESPQAKDEAKPSKEEANTRAVKPVFRPKMKPKIKPKPPEDGEDKH